MNIKELREKGAKAAADAQSFYKENASAWDAEKQAKFDAMVKEATDAQKEIQAIEDNDVAMDKLQKFYSEPQHRVQQPNADSDPEPKPEIKFSEAFSRYVKRKTNGIPEETLKECKETHKEAMLAYFAGSTPELIRYSQMQDRVAPKEIQALLSSDQTLGGFLVYDDIKNEIIKAEAGYAVLLPLVRVEPTSSSALVMPKIVPHSTDVRRTSGFAGRFQKEGYVTGGTAPTTQDKPTFARERIPVHDWVPYAVEITTNLLDDAGANLEGLIADSIGECLAFDKDDKILNGSGADEPEGVLNAGISTVASGGATAIEYGGMIGVYTEVPAQYRQRSTWLMASRTLGAILQLNTGTGGVYLFPPNGWANEILGRPVRFLDYGMDTATAAGGTTFTAGEYPIIFGDWSRYIIAQRAEMRIQRLVERFAPNIALLPSARFGGQVVLNEAFRIMRVAAS